MKSCDNCTDAFPDAATLYPYNGPEGEMVVCESCLRGLEDGDYSAVEGGYVPTPEEHAAFMVEWNADRVARRKAALEKLYGVGNVPELGSHIDRTEVIAEEFQRHTQQALDMIERANVRQLGESEEVP